ncbi:MAG: hypothetical protein ACTSYD_00795 [Candidatus Heimdallarchaeaceae archaeon]
MKIVFRFSVAKDIMSAMSEIASHYGSEVKKEDVGEGHFILVPPKLQITQRKEGDNYLVKVWGASDTDLDFLKEIFGDPIETIREKLSPLEFAKELLELASVNRSITRKQIINTFDITERDYKQYMQALRLLSKRSSNNEELLKALHILQSA